MLKAKYFLGAAAILFALYVIIGEQITGASSNAVVNGKMIAVNSPIAGFVEIKSLRLGQRFSVGEVIAKIENTNYDFSNFYDLNQEKEEINHKILEINDILKITDSEIADMQTELDKKRDFAIFENGRNITRSEERIRLFEEIESAPVTIKGDKLSARSVQNSIELSRARENVEIQREIRRNLLNNFFVGEGFNNISELQNKIRDRDISRLNLLVESNHFKERLISLQYRVDEEKKFVDYHSQKTIKIKNASLLWEKLISDGETVEQGQNLLRLLDCGSAMVSLSVSSNVYNKLEIGQNAIFFPDNSNLKYDAKVERLAGLGASRIYKNLAIPPSRANEERFDVLLNVPKLTDKVIETCTIGQTGRVFFDKRPFDWIRDLISK